MRGLGIFSGASLGRPSSGTQAWKHHVGCLGMRLVRREAVPLVTRLRGGSWDSLRLVARAVGRLNVHPAGRSDDIGFRVVRKEAK